MYYKIFIYLYCFLLLLSLVFFYRYLSTKQNQLDLTTKTAFRDDIKTGDIFLLDWQRSNNIFIASMFKNSFMHPAIALWEKGDLFIIELVNYFSDDKYRGFIKLPFNKWLRINKKGLILHNKLKIEDEDGVNKNIREELGNKINDFYIKYKGKMSEPSGFNFSWSRFINPSKTYKPIENFDNIICTEIISFMLMDLEIAEKNKSIESFQPDDFIKLSGFTIKKPYNYTEHYLALFDEQ
jgi:hypothetical protein